MAMRRVPLHIVTRATSAARISNSFRPTEARCYASAVSTDGTDASYVSPFQEIFDNVKENRSLLGVEFVPPEVKYLKCGVPEHVLRFKTTTYGRLLEDPFVRPMEHRVTLRVHMRYIPLSEMEQVVLKEIVGTRWNEETGMLQLSSAQFGSRIENKRHVVSMLDRIVESAKSLATQVKTEVEETA